MEKTNDLFATLMFQPNLSLDDLTALNITTENTGLKSKEDYKNIKAVQDRFKKDDGSFDEKAFSSFYDSVLGVYNNYVDKTVSGKIADTFKYDPFDWRYEDKAVDVTPYVTLDKNPMGYSANVRAMGVYTQPQWSMREIAQTNRVFDYEKGEWLDWTPNDQGGLLKGLLRPSLVLATWDEDGTHTENGRTVEHKKGDFKFDPITGKPFYETVGGREIYDKDVLHYSDTLTREGTTLNKYDFFDSDGLDKSVGGSIMKLTASLVPAFIGLASKNVGLLYGGISAFINLMQLTPTLGKAINGFITGDNSNTSVGRSLTDAEAWVSRFARSTSDYSRERTISIENAANLIKDVSLQLFQQRTMSSIPRLFKSNPKIYNNEKLARTLAYGYMSGTSALESYSAFKQAGANDRVAGIGMLATIGAFYKLMSIDYFRDSLFKGSWFDDNNVKSPVWKVAQDFMNVIKAEGTEATATSTTEASKRTLKTLTSRMVDGIKRQGKAFRPSTFFERSFAEGAEETMEEFFQDGIKVMFMGAEALGIPMNDQREKLDFGFSSEDILKRYGMAFGGGLLGGAIFQGYGSLEERIRNVGSAKVASDYKANLSELVKLIADGRGNEIKSVLNKWHKAERFGSNDLSGTKLRTITSLDGDKTVALPNEGVSQNDLIYQILTDEVDYVERVLEDEGFKNFESSGIKLAESLNLNKSDSEKAMIKMEEIGVHTLLYDDLNRLATDIVQMRGMVDSQRATHKPAGDTAQAKLDTQEEIKNDPKIKAYEEKLKELRKIRDDMKDGKMDDYYVSQYRLVLNSNPIKPFLGFSDFVSFVKAKYDLNPEELTDAQRYIAQIEFDKYTNGEKADTFRAIDVYRAMSERFADEINAMEGKLKGVIADSELSIATKGAVYLNALKDRDRVTNEINTLRGKTDKSEEDEQKIRDLEAKRIELNQEISDMRTNPDRVLFNDSEEESKEGTLIRKVTQLLNGELEAGTEVLSDVASRLKNAYQDWVSKKVLKRNHSELNSFYQLIAKMAPSAQDISIQYKRWVEDWSLDSEVFGSENRDTEISTNFKSLISSFYKNLFSGNDVAAKKDYDEAVALLKDNGITDDLVNNLMFVGGEDWAPMMVHIGEDSLPDFINSILSLKESMPSSAALDLLKDVAISIDETTALDIFELLDSEQKRVIELANLDDYVMSEAKRPALETAFRLLNAIKGLITGAADGTNQEINKYRKNVKKYAELSKEAAVIIADELDELMGRISFLLNLHDMNAGMKLREHKEISKNMHSAFLDKIKFHSDALKEKFHKEGFDDLDINRLLEKHGLNDLDFSTMTVDEFHDKEASFIAFESDIYDIVHALGYTSAEIITKINELFADDSKIWAQKSTRFSKDDNTKVTDYDFAFYLLNIMTLNANDFYVKFRDITKNFEKEPTYGHEYIVRMAYAMMRDVTAFNGLAELIGDRYENKAKGTDEYVKSRKKLLSIIFGLGGAGTGKSTSVAKTFLKMAEDLDTNITIMSFGDAQIKKLQADLEVTGDSTVTYDTFFSKACPDLLKPDNLEKTDYGQINAKSIVFDSEYRLYDSNKLNNIYICDEIETLNDIQLEALSKYCTENGILVLALGDNKQPGGKIKYTETKSNGKSSTDTYESGIEDCVIIKAPSLITSLRTLSQAKNDNANKLEILLDDTYRIIYDDYEKYINPMERDNYLESLFSGKSVTLKYSETAERIVGDEITGDTTRFDKQLDLAIQRAKNAGKDPNGNTQKVLIVYDDSSISKYQSDKYQKNENVELRSSSQALGGEFLYTFVDIDQDKELYDALKDLYMLTQRSQLYTCVLDKKGFWSGRINSIPDKTAGALLSMNPADIAEFKQWRLSALESLTPSSEYKNNLNLIEEKPSSSGEGSGEGREADDEESSAGTSSETPPPPTTPPAAPPAVPGEGMTVTFEETPVNAPAVESKKPDEIPEDKPESEEESNIPDVAKPVIDPTPEPEPIVPSEPGPVLRSNRRRGTRRNSAQLSEPKTTEPEPPVSVPSKDRKLIENLFGKKKANPDQPRFGKNDIPNESEKGKVRVDNFYKRTASNTFWSEQKKQTSKKKSLLSLLDWSSNAQNKENYRHEIIHISTLFLGAPNQVEGFKRIERFFRKYKDNDELKKYLQGNKITRFTHNPGTTTSTVTIEYILDDGTSLVIPICEVNGVINKIYNGNFRQKTKTYYIPGERISISSLMRKYPGLSYCKTGGIFVAESAINAGVDANFANRNDGVAFLAVGEGAQVMDWASIFTPEWSGNSMWSYSHSDKVQIVNFQKTIDENELKLALTIQYIAGLKDRGWKLDDRRGASLYRDAINWLSKQSTETGAKYIVGDNLQPAAKELCARVFNNKDWLKDNLTEDERSRLYRDSLATKTNSGIILGQIISHLVANPEKFGASSTSPIWTEFRRWLSFEGDNPRRMFILYNNELYYIQGAREDSKNNWTWSIYKNNSEQPIHTVKGNALGSRMGSALSELFTRAGIDPANSEITFAYSINDNTSWKNQLFDDQFFKLLFPVFDNNDLWNNIFSKLPYGFYSNVVATGSTKDGWIETSPITYTDHFTTDASEWYYSTYDIDESAFAEGDTEQEQMLHNDRSKYFEEIKEEIFAMAKRLIDSEVVNDILSEYNMPSFESYEDADSNIQQIIDEINDEILSETMTAGTKILKWKDGQCVVETVNSKMNALENGLHAKGLNFTDGSSPINMSDLQIYIFTEEDNGVNAFAWFDSTGTVHVSQTNTMKEFVQLYTLSDDMLVFKSENREMSVNNKVMSFEGTIIRQFLREVITGTLTNSTIDRVMKLPNKDMYYVRTDDSQFMINPFNIVCNFLERRLDEHEC